MTCIVGIEDQGKVYLGADSCSSNTWIKQTSSNNKLFTKGEFTIGFCGSWRMGQMLQYEWTPPSKSKDDANDMVFLILRVAESIRSLFKNGGIAAVEKSVESGGTFLLVYNHQLFEVQSDFSFIRSDKGFLSVGSGCYLAYGSLATTHKTKMKPKDRVKKALEVAEDMTPFVRSPFTYLTV